MTQELIQENENYEQGPRGLGGWLIIPIIGLFLSPLINLFNMILNIQLINSTNWTKLTTPGGDSYHSMFKPALYFETGCNVLYILISIYLLVLLFQKKKLLPKLIIFYYIFNVVIEILITVLVNKINADIGTPPVSFSIPAIISSLIWIAYFRKSKRVKNTFVND